MMQPPGFMWSSAACRPMCHAEVAGLTATAKGCGRDRDEMRKSCCAVALLLATDTMRSWLRGCGTA